MHMWFWFGTDLKSFLFSGYDLHSFWGVLATCLGLVSLAVVYEAMKILQIILHQRTVSSINLGTSGSLENSSLLLQVTARDNGTSTKIWNKWTSWIFEILHWSAHTTLGYILMLAVMTYNAYIAMALVFGAALGYWIFGMSLLDINLAEFQRAQKKILQCEPECADSLENPERRISTVSNVAEQLATEVNAEIHAPFASV